MKIIDYKNFDNKDFFEKFEKQLLSCDSFVAQKTLLIDVYNKKSFSRDELIKRKLNLLNKFKYDYGWFLTKYFDTLTSLLIGVVGSVIGAYASLDIIEKWKWSIGLFFIIAFAGGVFVKDALKIKVDFNKKDTPLYEIRQVELRVINSVLASMKDEVDIGEYMQ